MLMPGWIRLPALWIGLPVLPEHGGSPPPALAAFFRDVAVPDGSRRVCGCGMRRSR